MVDRSQVIKLLAKARFTLQSDAALNVAYVNSTDFERELSDYSDSEKLEITLEEFQSQYQYCTNAFLSSSYTLIYGEVIEVTGEVDDLHHCRCCGLRTMPDLSSWDQCGYCEWVDDGTTDRFFRSHHNKRFENMNDCLNQATKSSSSKLKEMWYK